MEEEKSIFSRFSSLFATEKENKEKIDEKNIEVEVSFWDSITNYTSSTYNSIIQSTNETYNATVDFISEKGTNIYNSTAETFVEIGHKTGELYDQIEIKEKFYSTLSDIDLNDLVQKLSALEIENKKAKNALKIVISFLHIFTKYQKANALLPEAANLEGLPKESQEVNKQVTSFMQNIDFKEVLREVRPYILYIPHPAAPVVYQLLSFFCD
ncbi:hypothetical protein [Capnocytophaga leadbetteri]|jgi:hypothetical protein